jgi:hypothetical protein
MKLWLDDYRNAPDGSWHVARTVTEAIRCIHNFGSEIVEISLDHDISHYKEGDEFGYSCDETFWPVALFVGTVSDRLKLLGFTWTPKITVHSANVDAGKEMVILLDEYGLEAAHAPMGFAKDHEHPR